MNIFVLLLLIGEELGFSGRGIFWIERKLGRVQCGKSKLLDVRVQLDVRRGRELIFSTEEQ